MAFGNLREISGILTSYRNELLTTPADSEIRKQDSRDLKMKYQKLIEEIDYCFDFASQELAKRQKEMSEFCKQFKEMKRDLRKKLKKEENNRKRKKLKRELKVLKKSMQQI